MSQLHAVPGRRVPHMTLRDTLAVVVLRRPLKLLASLAEKYGDVVHCKVGREEIFFLNHPDDIRELLVVQHENFRKGEGVMMLDMFYPVVRNIREKTALEHIIITSVADYLPPLLRRLYPLSQRRVKRAEPVLTSLELRTDPQLLRMRDLQTKTLAREAMSFQSPPLKSDDLDQPHHSVYLLLLDFDNNIIKLSNTTLTKC